jgi:hypothetical protein
MRPSHTENCVADIDLLAILLELFELICRETSGIITAFSVQPCCSYCELKPSLSVVVNWESRLYRLIRDLKYALRRLALTPGFTLATLVTLALGIGANTAIFNFIDSVLLKPLPFPEPDRLIGVWQTAPGVDIKDLNASIADYVTLSRGL